MANRLATSSSPYLLQHAENPVDWWPWGMEAISEARRRGVPIFLSAGYSTCYWCHVMERESFEDGPTARVMNERFVCVKVDREEHPEVDQVYMTALHVLTGHGGWPMNMFVEPEGLKPFWGGTYFPKSPRHNLPSFVQVLEGMAGAWATRREEVLKQAGAVAESVAEHLSAGAAPVPVGRPHAAMAIRTLLTIADPVHGGFGGAPKFPQAVYLEMLLDARERVGASADSGAAGRAAIDAVLRRALDGMSLGGVHDHVGGGFHRYSVDASWTVPHFEKMLYDQAQMLSVYARASGAFGDAWYGRVARRIAAYVLREMTDREGAFFTAQDAEVDGREGLNYLWSTAEMAAALGEDEARFAAEVFAVSRGPNFQDPHHPSKPGEVARNVLRLDERPEAAASRLGVGVEALVHRLDRVSEAMLAARAKRKQPRLDDKVLTSWNGLMIGALARAGQALAEPFMIAAAERAARAVLARHRPRAGALLHASRLGTGGVAGTLEDYAMLAGGLLASAEAAPDSAEDLAARADELLDEAAGLFGDGRSGYMDTQAGRPDLFVRARATYDGAMPSAASAMTHALLDRAERTGLEPHLRAAASAVAATSAAVAESPISAVNSTRAVLRMLALDEPMLVQALGPVREDAGGAATAGGPAVTIWASEDEVAVGPDEPASLLVRLEIAPGYHLTAPGGSRAAGSTRAVEVSVAGGSGVVAYADYPVGEPLAPEEDSASGGAGEAESHRVYRGVVEMEVALERVGAWSGEPRLVVTYQPCTDRSCGEPVSHVLDVRVGRRDHA